MDYQINLSNIENFSLLESGRSHVKLLTDSLTNKQYVLKMVSIDRDSIDKEYELLQKFNHPNIIKPIQMGCFNKNKYLVTEYMNKGDLFIFLMNNQEKILSKTFQSHKDFEKFWRSLFIQCLEALLHLKSHGWAHLDLKPENFLINSNFEIKLIDFEFAFQIDPIKDEKTQCNKYCGSQSYFSPEIKERNFPYDPFKSDVFSFAVTMLNLMSGLDIFRRNIFDMNRQYSLMKCNDFTSFWKSLSFSSFLSIEFKSLLEKMLRYDSSQRISIEEVRKDIWFQKEVFSKNETENFFEKFYKQIEKPINKQKPSASCTKKIKNI